MYRARPSFSYEILHGLHLPKNLSVLFAYLSYFPPPPPVLPGPPPFRSWTCSSSSSSCSLSKTRHPPSFRQYVPFPVHNQSIFFPSPSSISVNSTDSTGTSSLFESLLVLFRKHFLFVLLCIVIISISVTAICLIILCVYLHRHRQRQSTVENEKKTKKFYYRLIPHRRKAVVTKDNSTNHDRGHQLRRLRKDSSTERTIRVSNPTGIFTHVNDETEEAV